MLALRLLSYMLIFGCFFIALHARFELSFLIEGIITLIFYVFVELKGGCDD